MFISNAKIRNGMVLIERDENGRVTRTLRVRETGRCTADIGCRHVVATDRKTRAVHNMCYAECSQSEVQDNGENRR